MGIEDYISVIKSKLWLLLLGMFLASGTCYFIATTYMNWPNYQARATLLIQDNSTNELIQDRQSLEIAQRTLSVLATRAPLTHRVIDTLSLDISAKELAKVIQIRIPENASLIEVVATDQDPLTAASIANSVMQELHTHPASNIITQIVEPAKIPQSPLLSSYLLIVIAGIGGLLIAIGIVLLTEFLNNTVRHERDIRVSLGLPMLGMITESQVTTEKAIQTTKQSYQWIFANIFVNSKERPNTLLITSPQECEPQSDFVHRFVNQNLRGDFRPHQNQNILTAQQPSDSVLQLQEPIYPAYVEQGTFYDLEIDESLFELENNQPKTFRHIQIVDSPAVLSNANTMILAQRFDSILFVIEANKTKIRDIKQAKQLLNNSGTPIIGSVLLA